MSKVLNWRRMPKTFLLGLLHHFIGLALKVSIGDKTRLAIEH